MKLYFLRHGEAGSAPTDDLRELTDRGRREVAAVAAQARAELLGVDAVLVSPILRAQQTALVACQAIGRPPVWHTVDWLVHETPVREALAGLAALGEQQILLVGHQPLAGMLVQQLTGERIAVGTANLVVMAGESPVPGWLSLLRVDVP